MKLAATLFVIILFSGLAITSEAINPKFTPIMSRFKRDTPPIAAELKNTPCAPNDYLQLDCNTCYCNFDRTGYLCTENTCHDGPVDPPTSTQIAISENTMLLIREDSVHLLRNQNSNDNSLSRIGPDQKQTNVDTGPRHRITPRNHLQDDCFRCAGNAGQQTRDVLLKTFNGPETEAFTCEPGQQFYKDCNTCICTADGKNAMCTYKLCLKDQQEENGKIL